jgi:hypothetical protein
MQHSSVPPHSILYYVILLLISRLSKCSNFFMNTENIQKEILGYLIKTISSRSVPDCEYRLWFKTELNAYLPFKHSDSLWSKFGKFLLSEKINGISTSIL